ncbi:deoxyribose-phosphate aldolase [Candidatus Berkelbacteria bacterium RIFCSPHIGHO2_12_FULL_36_9]|uniref:Deoxyribose-phosphate aldolase n=1 Tax=Candidatus Berkelbacteria bacterium RIFCSPHIGHO2_12_FULL_36_9 TaxID=1797469 RepID=A0A1F5EKF4_9BACT|nr:MAG: deoxyribose-phosphate aldolase [Candidatus Berkelbacteria bacterium RIFCSPHIGHO2_12_FULL_36_9]
MSPKEIAKYIDHTNVKAEASSKDIEKLCQEAVKYGFHSVCVTPYRVKDASRFLTKIHTPTGCNNKVEIICVVGFPFGLTTTEEKIFESKTAVKDGATEIDMIINIGAIKDHNWDHVENEIRQIAAEIKPLGLKVIMEIGFLTRAELIKACKVAKNAGAKFVKTSTGHGPRKPTYADIRLMKKTVGKDIGVKASGGIHNFKTAKEMIEAGANRIGTSSGLQIIGLQKATKKKFTHGHGRE